MRSPVWGLSASRRTCCRLTMVPKRKNDGVVAQSVPYFSMRRAMSSFVLSPFVSLCDMCARASIDTELRLQSNSERHCTFAYASAPSATLKARQSKYARVRRIFACACSDKSEKSKAWRCALNRTEQNPANSEHIFIVLPEYARVWPSASSTRSKMSVISSD
eukprot:Amastigsp_a1659_36.p2 type:complete len:162 gc:universal Amastigsp_a1659_36:271-756(+)